MGQEAFSHLYGITNLCESVPILIQKKSNETWKHPMQWNLWPKQEVKRERQFCGMVHSNFSCFYLTYAFFFFFFPPRKLKGVDVFHHGKVKRGCYSLRNGLFRGNSPFDKWMRKSGAENVAQKFWTDRLWTCVDLKRINLKVCFSEGKYLLHFEISSPFKVAQLGLSVSLTALEKWPLIFLFVLRSNFPFSSSKKCVGK